MDRKSADSPVTDIRIGLGYVALLLERGQLGLAAVLRQDMKPGCTVMSRAGTLAGQRASSMAELLVTGKTQLEKTLGLAAVNAILLPEAPASEEDTLSLMNLTSADRVVMVGFFAPLVKKIEATGAALSIVELDPVRPGIHDSEDSCKALAQATVALITATSLLNGTLEPILETVKSARHVTLLGPSTPLSPEAFQDTIVSHLAGSVSVNNDKVLQVVSEGGGTPAMRPFLRFINLIRNEG